MQDICSGTNDIGRHFYFGYLLDMLKMLPPVHGESFEGGLHPMPSSQLLKGEMNNDTHTLFKSVIDCSPGLVQADE